MNWQPIDTATKDGSWLLLKGGKQNGVYEESEHRLPPVYVCRWSSVFDGWWEVGCEWDDGFNTAYDNPTHWMPLP